MSQCLKDKLIFNPKVRAVGSEPVSTPVTIELPLRAADSGSNKDNP